MFAYIKCNWKFLQIAFKDNNSFWNRKLNIEISIHYHKLLES